MAFSTTPRSKPGQDFNSLVDGSPPTLDMMAASSGGTALRRRGGYYMYENLAMQTASPPDYGSKRNSEKANWLWVCQANPVIPSDMPKQVETLAIGM
jgi:hypothetical protein